MADTEPFKLAVIGSRSFANTRLLDEVLSDLKPRLGEVVSGGARGADIMAERWARKNGVETCIFLPDHKRYRHAYHHRNRLIVERCDKLLAFWDGRSTGTRYTIEYAKRLGRPVKIVRF